MSRTHALDGVKNFRDFGGYQARGGRIKTGLLYRSGHHAAASEDDLAALAGMNIAVIVDLRHRHERAENPSRRWRDFAAMLIENDKHEHAQTEAEFDAAFNAYIDHPDATADGISGWSRKWYGATAFAPAHIDLFARYFRTLASAPGPVLIHCSRGKDRTGLLAALTQHVAGVSRADIDREYLLANGAIPTPADMGHGRAVKPEVFRALVDIKADYLDAAFDEMQARHGSVDGYLEQALGVDAKLRGAIVARILE